jgi:HEAT repeat protein
MPLKNLIDSIFAKTKKPTAEDTVKQCIIQLKSGNPAHCLSAIDTLSLEALDDPRIVPALLTVIQSDMHFVVRTEAAKAVCFYNTGHDSSQKIPVLLGIMESDSHPLLRKQAIETLAFLGDTRAVKPLFGIAKTANNPDLRAHAVWALDYIRQQIRNDANPNDRLFLSLPEVLEDPDAKVRKQGVIALRTMENSGTVRCIISSVAQDLDAEVRREAVTTLGVYSNSYTIQPLLAALNDADSKVQAHAASALGSKHITMAIFPLILLLIDSADNDTKNAVKEALIAMRKKMERRSKGTMANYIIEKCSSEAAHQAFNILIDAGVMNHRLLTHELVGMGIPKARAVLDAMAEQRNLLRASDEHKAPGNTLLRAVLEKPPEPTELLRPGTPDQYRRSRLEEFVRGL